MVGISRLTTISTVAAFSILINGPSHAGPEDIFETASADTVFWRSIENNQSTENLTSYLQHFPNGQYDQTARDQLTVDLGHVPEVGARNPAVKACVDGGRLTNEDKMAETWLSVKADCAVAYQILPNNFSVITAYALSLEKAGETRKSAELLHRTQSDHSAQLYVQGHLAYLLARAYSKADFRPFERDISTATLFMESATGLGISRANVDLVALYGEGGGTPLDNETKCNFYQSALYMGNAFATYTYANTCITKSYIDTWLPLMKDAAALGNRLAAYDLAKYYEGDQGDYSQALQFYQRAASLGHHAAQLSAAVYLTDGTGTETDYDAAIDWIKKGMARRDSEPQRVIGLMYWRGQGLTQSSKAAYYHMRLAVTFDAENASAADDLQYFSEDLTAAEIQEIDAFVLTDPDPSLLYDAVADQIDQGPSSPGVVPDNPDSAPTNRSDKSTPAAVPTGESGSDVTGKQNKSSN